MIENFKYRLALVRKLKLMSKKELSIKSKIPINKIIKLENGEAYPSSTDLIILSNILHVPIDCFFSYESKCKNINYIHKNYISKYNLNNISNQVLFKLENIISVDNLYYLEYNFDSNYGSNDIYYLLEKNNIKVIFVDATNRFKSNSFLYRGAYKNYFIIVINSNYKNSFKYIKYELECIYSKFNYAFNKDEILNNINDNYYHNSLYEIKVLKLFNDVKITGQKAAYFLSMSLLNFHYKMHNTKYENYKNNKEDINYYNYISYEKILNTLKSINNSNDIYVINNMYLAVFKKNLKYITNLKHKILKNIFNFKKFLAYVKEYKKYIIINKY